ncbi:MAG: prolipoprotein diacylglyceryl transferase [Terracidiphilus sp.]
MLPTIHLGFIPIHTYGLMMWCAAVAAAFILDRAFRRVHINADAMWMVVVALIVGIIGAKLWHLADTPTDFRELGWRALWDPGGFAWYGGFTFGLAALVIQGWRAKIGAVRILDLAAPAAAIGYGIGRIGCFLSGDGCYGVAITPVHIFGLTFHPWGMAFPHGIEPVFVPVYPTPLYELVGGLLIGWWLWHRLGKPHPTGAILGQYLLLTGVARFLVEFIRRNPKVLWGMSNAQSAAAGAVLAGIALIWWTAMHPDRAPSAIAEKTAAPVERTA